MKNDDDTSEFWCFNRFFLCVPVAITTDAIIFLFLLSATEMVN